MKRAQFFPLPPHPHPTNMFKNLITASDELDKIPLQHKKGWQLKVTSTRAAAGYQLTTYRFNFLDDFVLDVDVLKDGLHYHVAAAEAVVRDGGVQVGQDAVALKARAQKYQQQNS